jgi:hypothetical protein
MVQIVLFDTETNGLPKHREITGNIKQNNWPDILSICWMVYEGTNHVKTEYHLILYQPIKNNKRSQHVPPINN